MNRTQTLPSFTRSWRVAAAALAVTITAGCASVPNPTPGDPLESYNRSMDTFNYKVDRALFRPVASAYEALTPRPAQNCIRNIFNNMGDLWSAVNSFLQARPHDFFNTLGRVLFNTTLGVGGCFDFATQNGAQRIANDFGTTLGVWGVPTGPYIVLPLIGPSTGRDTLALSTFALNASEFSQVAPIMSINKVRVRNSLLGLYLVDMRANLLKADDLVDEVALDRYSFIRDAYLQRRNAMVNQRLKHASGSSDANLPDYGDDYGDDELPNYED